MQKVSFLVDEELAQALPRLMSGIENFLVACAASPNVSFAVQFAVEEVVTNALTHGAKRKRPEVQVELSRDGDFVVIEISDDGAPFNPLCDAPQPDVRATLDEREPGGLGLHLLRKTMDSAQYRAQDGRNRLTLRKRLTGALSAEA